MWPTVAAQRGRRRRTRWRSSYGRIGRRGSRRRNEHAPSLIPPYEIRRLLLLAYSHRDGGLRRRGEAAEHRLHLFGRPRVSGDQRVWGGAEVDRDAEYRSYREGRDAV